VPDLSSEDVLFIGREKETGGWYRCVLPANALGCDWITIQPDLSTFTGTMQKDNWEDYHLWVVQLAVEPYYLDRIKKHRSKGGVVLYDNDDFTPSIRKIAKGAHVNSDRFHWRKVEAVKKAMRACDGIITTNQFLAEKYKQYGPTWVCRNGIDLQRYQYTRRPHNEFRFGWAGAPGVGHREAMGPWLSVVADVLREIPDSRFYSVGEPFALDLKPEFGDRAVAIPWVLLEVFPMTLLNFDVGLAPALYTDFWKGKSDLRFLEYSAMGLTTIGDPNLYPIKNWEDGVWAAGAHGPQMAKRALLELSHDENLRMQIAHNANCYVQGARNHKVTGLDWIKPFEEVMG
jgi:glycosyltransferase involved in cell wall biosynthesis